MRGGPGVGLEVLREQGYSTVICFQVMPPPKTVRGTEKVVLIPYDADHTYPNGTGDAIALADFIVQN